jgi:prephenate dehydrogenase
MSHDIFLTNREAAVHWLERMIEELRRYRDLLEGDAEELLETFGRAQMDRDTFIAQPHAARLDEEEPDVRQELVNSLMGGWISDRLKRARELPGVIKEGETARAEKRRTKAEQIAEDIRRDLEKTSKSDHG